jgi:hypothetical protein
MAVLNALKAAHPQNQAPKATLNQATKAEVSPALSVAPKVALRSLLGQTATTTKVYDLMFL